jgi:hypothetical protein
VLIGDVDPRAESTVHDIIPDGGKAAFQKTNGAPGGTFDRCAKR